MDDMTIFHTYVFLFKEKHHGTIPQLHVFCVFFLQKNNFRLPLGLLFVRWIPWFRWRGSGQLLHHGHVLCQAREVSHHRAYHRDDRRVMSATLSSGGRVHPVHLLAGTLGSSKHVGVEVGILVWQRRENWPRNLFWSNFRVEDFWSPWKRSGANKGSATD